MNKSFKMITMRVGGYETLNFKQGVARAKAIAAKEIRFSWESSNRISNEVYCNRVKAVFSTLTGLDIDDFDIKADGTTLVISRASGEPVLQ